MSRRYPTKDIKLLWGLSAGRCAFPDCRQPSIIDGTEVDDRAIIGKIAHIYAHSNEGPRAKPDLTDEERDRYDNWVILCSRHHDLVDAQPNTFTAEDLLSWKRDLETWVSSQLATEIAEITFVELEIVTQALLQSPMPPSSDFTVISPHEKMARNDLTDSVLFMVTLGIGKSKEVEDFVEHVAVRDPSFPERLRAGFVNEYNRLRDEGYVGDSLFEALRQFASNGNSNFARQAAGLAVLIYLFEKCEVFEK
ncbi:MAG TPA: HNH endonuclease signature motif containing protein [Chloroflexota bacterium]|nr:HNH endonuclease signature motif containing protein [Chloroflexota bacterium]HUM67278.1 HNH endonuclease signature motif containing protein [Chloroflexota bacterium]